MEAYKPLPPSIHHTTTRLTHLEAHTFLSNFLGTAENEAAYRPDSTLTERGPVSASTSGSGGLTLGNLKRILKGLEGKRVGGANLKVNLDGEDGASAGASGQKRRRTDQDKGSPKRRRQEDNHLEVDAEDGEPVARMEDNASAASGWQDQAAFELEQDENLDAMNEDRDPGAALEQPENEQEEQEIMEVEVESTGQKVDSRTNAKSGGAQEKSQNEKDKRKEDKKDRKKEEKAQREKERSKKKDG